MMNSKIKKNKIDNNARSLPTVIETRRVQSASPSIPLLSKYTVRQFRALRTRFDALDVHLGRLDATVANQTKGFEACIDTVSKCQDQTAKMLNSQLERHALNPAIEAVVALAEELAGLKTKSITAEPNSRLTEEINIAAAIASEKLAYLDIEKISPGEFTCLIPHHHEVCGAQQTDNPQLHGKISMLLSCGIIYRGKVLKPAKVSVYRYTD